MDINNLFGIPAHPLLVHLPVILVPLAAILALVAAAWPRHRRRLAWAAAAITGVALIATQFAIGSGEKMQDRVKDTDLVRRHAQLGGTVRWYVLVLFIALVVLALLPHSSYTAAQAKRRRASVAGATVVILVTAIGSVITVVQAGHSGAKAVWNGTPATYTQPSDSPSGPSSSASDPSSSPRP